MCTRAHTHIHTVLSTQPESIHSFLQSTNTCQDLLRAELWIERHSPCHKITVVPWRVYTVVQAGGSPGDKIQGKVAPEQWDREEEGGGGRKLHWQQHRASCAPGILSSLVSFAQMSGCREQGEE